VTPPPYTDTGAQIAFYVTVGVFVLLEQRTPAACMIIVTMIGIISPAAKPCATRNAISEPMLQAFALSTDPIKNMTRAAMVDELTRRGFLTGGLGSAEIVR